MKQLRGLYAQTFFTLRTFLVVSMHRHWSKEKALQRHRKYSQNSTLYVNV